MNNATLRNSHNNDITTERTHVPRPPCFCLQYIGTKERQRTHFIAGDVVEGVLVLVHPLLGQQVQPVAMYSATLER